MKNQLAQFKKQVVTLQQEALELKLAVESANNECSEVKERLQSKQDEIKAMEDEVKAARAETEAANQKVKEMTAELNELGGGYDGGLALRLKQLEATNAKLTKELETARASADLQNDLDIAKGTAPLTHFLLTPIDLRPHLCSPHLRSCFDSNHSRSFPFSYSVPCTVLTFLLCDVL